MIGSPTGEFVAEATTAAHSDGYAPEWERDYGDLKGNFDVEGLLSLATVRLANAIASKYDKYKKSYSTLGHVQGKPFVLCVAPFEQPFFFLQNDQALRRVLYTHDQPLVLRDRESGHVTVVGESMQRSVTKDNGTTIDLGFFTNEQMKEVSAVIFSNTATFTKVRALTQDGSVPILFFATRFDATSSQPRLVQAQRPHYRETLLDGLHVYLNPFAKYPFDISLFRDREVALHSYASSVPLYIPLAPDGFLIEHACMSFVSTDGEQTLQNLQPQRKYKTPSVNWPEGELRDVGGWVAPFVDNHMAHYRGWTIVVARW